MSVPITPTSRASLIQRIWAAKQQQILRYAQDDTREVILVCEMSLTTLVAQNLPV